MANQIVCADRNREPGKAENGGRGYTDASQREAINATLSKQRANYVADELVKRGVPPDIIYTAGLGNRDPITRGDVEVEPINRRAVIFIYPEN